MNTNAASDWTDIMILVHLDEFDGVIALQYGSSRIPNFMKIETGELAFKRTQKRSLI